MLEKKENISEMLGVVQPELSPEFILSQKRIIGQAIKNYRLKMGFSIYAVHKFIVESGITYHRTHIHAVENGSRMFRFDTFLAYLSFLGLSFADLQMLIDEIKNQPTDENQK